MEFDPATPRAKVLVALYGRKTSKEASIRISNKSAPFVAFKDWAFVDVGTVDFVAFVLGSFLVKTRHVGATCAFDGVNGDGAFLTCLFYGAVMVLAHNILAGIKACGILSKFVDFDTKQIREGAMAHVSCWSCNAGSWESDTT